MYVNLSLHFHDAFVPVAAARRGARSLPPSERCKPGPRSPTRRQERLGGGVPRESPFGSWGNGGPRVEVWHIFTGQDGISRHSN